ncbi:hypothetical protein ACUR5C_04570 [Aliikangiella sp. IMCC44653]
MESNKRILFNWVIYSLIFIGATFANNSHSISDDEKYRDDKCEEIIANEGSASTTHNGHINPSVTEKELRCRWHNGDIGAGYRLAIKLRALESRQTIEVLKELIASGHVGALSMLGELYKTGSLVVKDEKLAFKYFHEASFKADFSAALELLGNETYLNKTTDAEKAILYFFLMESIDSSSESWNRVSLKLDEFLQARSLAEVSELIKIVSKWKFKVSQSKKWQIWMPQLVKYLETVKQEN